jgi:hypothetical protein
MSSASDIATHRSRLQEMNREVKDMKLFLTMTRSGGGGQRSAASGTGHNDSTFAMDTPKISPKRTPKRSALSSITNGSSLKMKSPTFTKQASIANDGDDEQTKNRELFAVDLRQLCSGVDDLVVLIKANEKEFGDMSKSKRKSVVDRVCVSQRRAPKAMSTYR